MEQTGRRNLYFSRPVFLAAENFCSLKRTCDGKGEKTMKALRHIGSTAFVLGLFTAIFAGLPWYVMVSEDPVTPWWLKTAVFCLLGGILLVMGTLCRTGIPGFFIGNTAETILNQVDCSVLTVKPKGFVSPVK